LRTGACKPFADQRHGHQPQHHHDIGQPTLAGGLFFGRRIGLDIGHEGHSIGGEAGVSKRYQGTASDPDLPGHDIGQNAAG
jgi:hypothetical protein